MIGLRPILLMAAAATVLSAQTVMFTDFNNPDDWDFMGDAPLGQSFTTAAAFRLTSVTVKLRANNSEEESRPAYLRSKIHSRSRVNASNPKPKGSQPNSSVIVSLYSNSGNAPGTLIATSSTTVLDTSLNNSVQSFIFTFANIQLSANTRYWIVMTTNNGSSAQWLATDEPSGAVTSEFWASDGDTGPAGEFAFELQVSGIAASVPAGTPAPSSVLLVTIGLAAAASYVRRQRQAVN